MLILVNNISNLKLNRVYKVNSSISEDKLFLYSKSNFGIVLK